MLLTRTKIPTLSWFGRYTCQINFCVKCDLDPEIKSYPGVMKDYPRTKFGVDMNSSFPIMTQTDERKHYQGQNRMDQQEILTQYLQLSSFFSSQHCDMVSSVYVHRWRFVHKKW